MRTVLHKGWGRIPRTAIYILLVLHTGIIFAGFSTGILAELKALPLKGDLALIPLLFVWPVVATVTVAWYLSPWIYPIDVVLEEDSVYVKYMFHERRIPLDDILWIEGYRSSNVLVEGWPAWAVVKIGRCRFPHSWCVFLMQSPNKTGRPWPAPFDRVFEKFRYK